MTDLDIAALRVLSVMSAAASAFVWALAVSHLGLWLRRNPIRPVAHHFYLGIPFMLAPESWGVVAVLAWTAGVVLMADDAYQHARQIDQPLYRGPLNRWWNFWLFPRLPEWAQRFILAALRAVEGR